MLFIIEGHDYEWLLWECVGIASFFNRINRADIMYAVASCVGDKNESENAAIYKTIKLIYGKQRKLFVV